MGRPREDDGVVSPALNTSVASMQSEIESEASTMDTTLDSVMNCSMESQREGSMKAEWVPDDNAQDCSVCFARFTTLRWRHHCRICGGVVCGKCSESRVFVPGHEKLERACNSCVTAA